MSHVRIATDTFPTLRKALEIMQIKAAVEGNVSRVIICENAMDELNRALIDTLPDRMGTVRCDMTVPELMDLKLCLSYFLNHGAAPYKRTNLGKTMIARLQGILERVKTTIALNGG